MAIIIVECCLSTPFVAHEHEFLRRKISTNLAEILATYGRQHPRRLINFRDWQISLSRKSGIVGKCSEFYIL